MAEKRITHAPELTKYIENKKVIVERECKNAFRLGEALSVDYIAYRLILLVFERYQSDGELPQTESFIQ